MKHPQIFVRYKRRVYHRPPGTAWANKRLIATAETEHIAALLIVVLNHIHDTPEGRATINAALQDT